MHFVTELIISEGEGKGGRTQSQTVNGGGDHIYSVHSWKHSVNCWDTGADKPSHKGSNTSLICSTAQLSPFPSEGVSRLHINSRAVFAALLNFISASSLEQRVRKGEGRLNETRMCRIQRKNIWLQIFPQPLISVLHLEMFCYHSKYIVHHMLMNQPKVLLLSLFTSL